ncbi:MAG: hypothetical protein K9N23_02940 [Akkermansiaceae bacterium]|nr:hypothetical protein [Akkermansiaceae bacterium]MCF7730610.1 hypothetical protein [Akkermansiaceae bacterium]
MKTSPVVRVVDEIKLHSKHTDRFDPKRAEVVVSPLNLESTRQWTIEGVAVQGL